MEGRAPSRPQANRHSFSRLFLAAVLFLGMAAQGLAQEPAEQNIRTLPKRLSDYGLPGLDQKVYLDSTDPWDVVQLIDFLAIKGNLKNIVIGKGVSGLTTKLRFDGVSVGDALDIVLSVNRLAYEIKGDVIMIMTDEEYMNLYGMSFYDQKQVRILKLQYADPLRVATMLEKIKSTIGYVVADPVTGTLMLIDTPEKILEMQTVAEKADIETVSRILPTESKTFVIQYGDIEKIQAEVAALLSKEAGSVQADPRTKTLIVTDLPHTMRRVEHLIQLFDSRPRQVFIEAKVVEVALTDDFSLGINWQHVFNGLDPRFEVRSISTPGSPATPVGTLTYNTILGGGDLNLVLQALKTLGDTRIISNPQVAVMDGQEATIEVVEDQPYKEVALESGTTNVTGVTYLFKKVGVILSVTPRINQDDFVSVNIRPEISSISEWYDGAPQQGTPVVKKAHAETTVMVKNGVTIIIGGMIADRKDKVTSKVPLLGDLPLLGRLFRQDSISTKNTETVVFMTPRIITGEEPFLLMKDMKKTPKPLRGSEMSPEKALKPIR